MVGIHPDRQGGGATTHHDVESILRRIALGAHDQIGAENFPVALRVVPRRPRERLTALYRYARFVDDVGDEAAGDRDALLDRVEADVRAIDGGTPSLPPVVAMGAVVRDCAVPLETLLDLVRANRMDQRVTHRDSFDDLLAYCALSAAPVGRAVLHIAAAATPVNVLDSDQVCAALQVLEHCQDVGEDAHAGRVYLPTCDLRAAGLEDADLLTATTTPALRRVVATQVDRAADLLGAGPALVGRLSGWARLAVAGYVAGGRATVDALRAHDHDVLAHAVRPTTRRTVRHALTLLARRGNP